MQFQKYNVSGTPWIIDTRYRLIRRIGNGSYGMVCSAVDTFTRKKVAIKRVSNIFESPLITKRTHREIKVLKHFNHENILTIQDTIPIPSLSEYQDVYIITDLMDTDLNEIIRSPQPLTDEHIQYFLYQILRGVKCVHSANVLHRDLKPSNILINSNSDIKICDFGLARGFEEGNEFESIYVQTRWYRSPEVLLMWKHYGTAMDVWSVGCILAELLGRKALFPGTNYKDQLVKVVQILGTPSDEELRDIGSDKARQFLKNLPQHPKKSFEALFPNSHPDALSLLDRMLTFDPERRITAEEALDHPYLETLHDPDDEPTSLSAFDYTFENEDYTLEQYRAMIYEEIMSFHPRITELASRHEGSIPDIDILPDVICISEHSPDIADFDEENAIYEPESPFIGPDADEISQSPSSGSSSTTASGTSSPSSED